MKKIRNKRNDQKRGDKVPVIALAGNPNVGKSTLFNQLTGMRQHTGNWPGKTVVRAEGEIIRHGRRWRLIDLPGTYSLAAHSKEEEAARDFLCLERPDVTVVLCDATCLERNLNLVLQVMEITPRVVVCVNLMDEALRKGIRVDVKALERLLGVPAVGICARKKKDGERLLEQIERALSLPERKPETFFCGRAVAQAAERLLPAAEPFASRTGVDPRWLTLRLLEGDAPLPDREGGKDGWKDLLLQAETVRDEANLDRESVRDSIVQALLQRAGEIAAQCVRSGEGNDRRDRAADRVLLGKWTAVPVMLLLLAGVFYLTILGANGPSALLSGCFSRLEELFFQGLERLGAPLWLRSMLLEGVWRVLSWVVAVMLPPMAIFFPLFTLLEDLGYLPRAAFVLDRPLERCGACGKQALTMCMGLGCNAAGVTGCRIIDSPRERMIAVLTNSFVPCNGRFPLMLTLCAMFFGAGEGAAAAAVVLAVVLLGVGTTLAASRLLSRAVLRGVPSFFALELPPYRRPQVGKVIVRSVLDRTVFVLGRAIAVAAPAGLLLWLLSHCPVGEESLLAHMARALDPAGKLLGMDGALFLAFVLGFPANEIVLPIALMIYQNTGVLEKMTSLLTVEQVLRNNGWTVLTAVCVMIFSLLHWPCSTTCLTIRKETGSWKWTLAAMALPTAFGAGLCALVAWVGRLAGF